MIFVDKKTGEGLCRTCWWRSKLDTREGQKICKECSKSFIDSDGLIAKSWVKNDEKDEK